MPGLFDAVIGFTEVSSVFAKKALDHYQEAETAKAAAEKAAVPVYTLMKSAGFVEEGMEEQCKALLGSHAETLGLLKQALDRIQGLTNELAKSATTKAANLGHGVDAAEAGLGATYDSLTDNYVGRMTSEVKASDRPFLRMIGH